MSIYQQPGTFYLGKLYDSATAKTTDKPLLYRSKDLTTHAVCVGMTGSGKTGFGITLLEEAALNSIPSIIIDPKGDMGNILLAFPNLTAEEFKPWIDQGEAERKGESLANYASEVAKTWKEGLAAWGETAKQVQNFKDAVSMAIYTPASQAGIPLSILNSFEAPPKEFALDIDAMRNRVLSTTSSILGLLGIAADPIKSREHILISTIIDRTWKDGKNIDLAILIQQIQKPQFDKIGVLDIDTFFPPKERTALSINLNNLLAAPGFQTWMEGAPLDIQKLLYTSDNKPKISVLSIAHLNDSERMFFVTLFLNQLIAWTRKQAGTSSLRAIFYMDEIFGYFPPTATPPSKEPMLTLLKQARAFGLGIVLCTQNPVDLDYKGLSNCGTWFIGRLQTARDKMRITEGLAVASNGDIDAKAIDKLMSAMSNRVFIMRSIYEKEPILFQTRWSLSYLRGPLTLAQIQILTLNEQKKFNNVHLAINSANNSNIGAKPVVPGNLPEYFVPPAAQISNVVNYRPYIAGFSKLHFVDKKYNLDEWLNSCLTLELQEEKILPWENGQNQPDLKQRLTNSPVPNATYQELPATILSEKKINGIKQDLATYLYQNNTLKILEFKDLKMISKPAETEEDFRSRVAIAIKERNAVQIGTLREEYGKKIELLKDKIRKCEEKKSAQQKQSFYQKFEAFLAFITTVIGGILGKKLNKTTINQAGTTFRKMGRIEKESQDVNDVQDNLQALQRQLQETSDQQEIQIAKLAAVDVSSLKFDQVEIRPRKSDINVDEVALLWWPSAAS